MNFKPLHALSMVLLISSTAFASREQEHVDIRNELAQEGISVAGLLNTTQQSLISSIANVGGESVLEESRTYFKIAYRASLVVDAAASPMTVVVQTANGSSALPEDAAYDLATAAMSFVGKHPDPRVREKASSKFMVYAKCIDVSGQGYDEPITWCGFSHGAVRNK